MSTSESENNNTEKTEENVRRVKTVLPHHMAGGPKGLGIAQILCSQTSKYSISRFA